MTVDLDVVAVYGQRNGWNLKRRTFLVEGVTDEQLFKLAARLEFNKTGIDLFSDGLEIIAAGIGDAGGTRGVIRELNCLRQMARCELGRDGQPRYRFMALFDNDPAGKQAVNSAKGFDLSILEYKDVFRLQPVMPICGNVDPKTLQKQFERANEGFKGLDWEIEDLLPDDFFDTFLADNPGALKRNTIVINGKQHRELTPDGKSRLHRYIKQHAMLEDLAGVIAVLRAMRCYACLPAI